MRKNTITIILLFVSVNIFSQPWTNDQRTIETKIADLLMKLPSPNSEDNDKLMAELAAMGEPAVTGITAGLVAPGKGLDATSRYAISGLVKYLAKGADRGPMKSCSLALCKAIGSEKENEVKDFLLQELQYVADDEAVPVVSAYLANERLCDQAARVMVRIGSDLAKQALYKAMQEADSPRQTILVAATGQLRYAPAAEKLRELAKTSDPGLKKAVLRALAEVGDLPSAGLLATEAKKAGYFYNSVDAVGSYLLFLERAVENGNHSFTGKACKKIIRKRKIPSQTRSAVLRILALSKRDDAQQWLLKALKSGDKEYRTAALALLSNRYYPEVPAKLQEIATATKNSELKVELLALFSEKRDKSALPLVLNNLESKNGQIRLAAIRAAAKIGQSDAIAPVAGLIKNGDHEIRDAVRKALLTIGGKEVSEKAASLIPQVSGNAKIVLMEIIAARRDSRYTGLILNEAKNPDSNVRLSAIRALPYLVSSGDEVKISGLFKDVFGEDEITALQDAMALAVKDSGEQQGQVAVILELMKKAGENRVCYYPVLARIGGQEALSALEKEYESGREPQKEAILNVLAGWDEYSSLETLFQICKNHPGDRIYDTALTSHIRGINESKNPVGQRVLMFRKAMRLAKSTELKRQVLQGIAENKTLLSLIFVSKYLDDDNLGQTAIQSVTTIVLNNKELYGEAVEEIIRKTIARDRAANASERRRELLNHLASLPPKGGFTSMFNGKNLTGWKGLVENPITRPQMTPEKLAEEQRKADELMRHNWKVDNGILYYIGEGYLGSGFDNLCSEKMYGDFELIVDWRIEPKSDGGIYLRGTPQVQIWDPENPRRARGENTGSGALHNNRIGPNRPLVVADNPVGEWNTFRIKMVGEKVTVYLNGQLAVDNVVMENYWDRSIPIFDKESIELQAHRTQGEFRDIYVREIPRTEPYSACQEEAQEGFVPLFNGTDIKGWRGAISDYSARDGMIVFRPSGDGYGNLFTEKTYGDYIMRFEFQLTPGANNGLGIRLPEIDKAIAYNGIELQILDNEAEIYKNLKPYQYHGSVYGVIPAKRGFLKPVGEWNFQEVQAIGTRIKITLNGEVILDGDMAEAGKNGTMDGKDHPGLLQPSGYIGLLGHGTPVFYRKIRIKDLSK